MMTLHPDGNVTPEIIVQVATVYGSPCYLYDETDILRKCRTATSMPSAFGLRVRYAMKANPNTALLQIITSAGLDLDASSMNEVRRARIAGIPFDRMLLTGQHVPVGGELQSLRQMMDWGLIYNACSLRQLEAISGPSAEGVHPIFVRIHPGKGSGETSTRDTGSAYSCFGIHLEDIQTALSIIRERKLLVRGLHVHVGSGGNPEIWRESLETALGLICYSFPEVEILNMGGGFRVARMPDESSADLRELGTHASDRLEDFRRETGRTLRFEIEPGTFIVASSGYLVTRVLDRKSTGRDGYRFAIVDGGMDTNARPMLYGSRHPFYLVSRDGVLRYSDFGNSDSEDDEPVSMVVVGKCCETGDCHTLDRLGNVEPRKIIPPEPGDLIVIGGTGAYCSTMAPSNYNSSLQPPEILLRTDHSLVEIRRQQSMAQVIANEVPLMECMISSG
jgi:diaminopimelate decarboxylase